MAIDSWERYAEISALMQPGGTDVSPMGDRTGIPIELELPGDDVSGLVACEQCGKLFPPRRPDARFCHRFCRWDWLKAKRAAVA